LIAGGGTGGHLTPALAVAEALLSSNPSADEVLLVGRRGGVAETLAEAAGVPMATLSVSGLDLSSVLSTAQFAARMPAAVVRARSLIRKFSPDVVVGAAGYVCVPVVLAARSMRIPVVLMEQNAFPGRAVRMLARFSRAVAASFASTAAHLTNARVVYTGNPVRDAVVEARGRAGGPPSDNILVMGGSQGAHTLNQATCGCVAELLERSPALSVTHITGAAEFAQVEAQRQRLGDSASRYRVEKFSDNIAARIAESGLVVMRAGGSSLAECTVIGRPMILVPYPHAGDHQRHNAKPYVDAGAATSVADAEFDAPRMLREVEAVIGDATHWAAMTAASRQSGKPEATRAVVDLIREVAGR
jgi:UDP-N-acetylglucosamine--N-acetylmuramyl-(pentapeptide) pyrophosphoryl-undecaprenol N-acetylglucosamine transferase